MKKSKEWIVVKMQFFTGEILTETFRSIVGSSIVTLASAKKSSEIPDERTEGNDARSASIATDTINCMNNSIYK